MPRKRKHKMAEDLNSEVLVISNSKQFRIQLKLLLDQSPLLEGICYPPIEKIYFQQFNDEVIKKVIQFCKYQRILDAVDEEGRDELIKFAEHTKMDKLKEYLFPRLEAQGEIMVLPQLPAITDISDEEEEEEDVEVFHPEPQGAFIKLPLRQASITDESEEEENMPSAQLYSINLIMIKPQENNQEDQIRPQSYIPQDPLHSFSTPQMAVTPITILPSTALPPQQRQMIYSAAASHHPPLSRAPSSAEEAEEGIIGEKAYGSVSYIPQETLTFQPIPAAEAAPAQNGTFIQRIRSFFS